MSINTEKKVAAHILYPLSILVFLTFLINFFNIDERLADYLYALQGGTWAWKNHWLTENFFHKGGHDLSIGVGVICISLLIASYANKAYTRHRKPLAYLVFAVAGSSLMVSLLKASLAISCPWEFARYGGTLYYHTVAEQLFLRNGSGCFPAGQASAGYAWIALYFFGCCYQSQWRWAGLVTAMIAGAMLGIAQQVRGAHFISHDLWTLGLCWFFSLSLYYVMFNKTMFKQFWQNLVYLGKITRTDKPT